MPTEKRAIQLSRSRGKGRTLLINKPFPIGASLCTALLHTNLWNLCCFFRPTRFILTFFLLALFLSLHFLLYLHKTIIYMKWEAFGVNIPKQNRTVLRQRLTGKIFLLLDIMMGSGRFFWTPWYSQPTLFT